MEPLYSNPMVAQVRSIPDLIRSVTESYHAAIRATVDSHLCCSLERIFLTGCGDSHHAALGCELAFEHLTGLSTEAMTSLQLARFSMETIPDPSATLIVGISVSGEVSRTLEALLQGRKAGVRLLAMTATPASRIARASEIVIDTTQTPYQDPPGLIVPGVRSYAANQIGLLLLAVHIGELRGHISETEAQNYRKEIADLAISAKQTIKANDQLAKEIAHRWEDASEFVFLGGGPNLASACFAAAKVLEASGDSAIGQDLEEWAHLQYFARAVTTPTFIISAGERDLSRAIEVAEAARAIGRRVAVIAPARAIDR
jgi:glucosamine--fructose-6-phosphate aminotransferase (isomerizing)